MENIFSPEPQFRQGQYQKLSDNMNEWEEEIYSNLSTLIPSELGLKTMLHWQKVDDGQGYGVGSAVLTNKGGKSVGIPLIIKQWHLAPLDTIMLDDKAYPLTPESIKEVFQDAELGNETAPRHGPTQIFDSGVQYESTYPPVGGGRYVYSSPVSMLRSIKDTLWEEDIEDFKKTAAANDGEILVAMHNRSPAGYELMAKLAKEKGKKPAKKKGKKKSVVHVSKKGVNDYQILGTSKGVFDPVEHGFIDRPTMKSFVKKVTGGGEAEEEALTRIDKNREYTHIQRSGVGEKETSPVGRKLGEHGEIFLYKTEEVPSGNGTSCDSPGVYAVRDKAGVSRVGYVLPNVIKLDGSKAGIKIFVGNGISATQKSFYGTPDKTRDIGLTESEPQHGELGTLVHESNGKVLATVPLRIKSCGMYPDCSYIRAKDYYGDEVDISLTDNAKGITKIKDGIKRLKSPNEVKRYNAPKGLKWISLGESKQFAESASTDRDLGYAKSASINPLKVIRFKDHYIFKAAGLDKYASVNGVNFDFSNLDEGRASFLLGAFGCPSEKIAEVLKYDDASPEIQVHGLDWPKLASEVPEDTRRDDFIRSLRCNLVKEAAVLEEGEAVDAALSLGFINPDNVNKFVESIPKLKECLSLLSKLLIAARLGMTNIPEDASQAAIHNIMRVVSGLKKLGLMQQNPMAA